MIKRNYRIFRAVYQQNRRSNGGRKVDVGESIPGQCAAAFQDDTVDGEKGGVEDETADGVAFFGCSGGEVAGGAGAEGSSVQYNVGCGDSEDVGEVGIGGVNVGEAVFFRGVS